MWTERARSWRNKGKRAVSPIIATILLVAITVVLAAVLYILISGLTKGPGNTPLGTAFGWGSVSKFTGTGKQYCTTGHLCYSVAIASASSGIQSGSLQFQVKTASGTIVVGPSSVNLENINGQGIGIYTVATNAWDNSTVSITTTMTFVLDSGGASALTGNVLIALGTGSYSGQVSTTLT
jgi:archaeal type IV pilus assembly protein PilA